jgi:nucleotidyltransferase/DNA polymerase involved in DNA repair
MVACVLYPRFPLLAALGGRAELLGRPVALAPDPGGRQVVGEVSAAAETFGIAVGMRVGEALARCPDLRLVPPDPDGVRSAWGRVLDRLGGIGAECESDRAGVAHFQVAGLRGIHGGRVEGVLGAARGAVGRAARLGCGPSRFASYAAALQARPRARQRAGTGGKPALGVRPAVMADGSIVVPEAAAAAFLAPLPVALLRTRPELAELPEVLERLGIRTLGELAALPAPAMAERFGHPGLLALDLARGRDTPLEPRRPPEPVGERIDLPEAASGPQLERALELLVARVLARRERRGRTVRALGISARFVEGGTWRTRVTLRQPSAESDRIRTALVTRLAELPAPAEALGLDVEAFGPPAHDQGRLLGDSPVHARRRRIADAVGQARQAAGAEAALRVLEVDPGSRLPERRAVLAPFETGDAGGDGP